MLIVVILNVIMLSVVAPFKRFIDEATGSNLIKIKFLTEEAAH